MADARQVNAHCPRMWRLQKSDKLVAHRWRGININPTEQGCQCAILVGDSLHARLLNTFAVVARHGIRSLPARCFYARTASSEFRIDTRIAIRVPQVSASKCVKIASL